jgi:hypothetical protein
LVQFIPQLLELEEQLQEHQHLQELTDQHLLYLAQVLLLFHLVVAVVAVLDLIHHLVLEEMVWLPMVMVEEQAVVQVLQDKLVDLAVVLGLLEVQWLLMEQQVQVAVVAVLEVQVQMLQVLDLVALQEELGV